MVKIYCFCIIVNRDENYGNVGQLNLKLCLLLIFFLLENFGRIVVLYNYYDNVKDEINYFFYKFKIMLNIELDVLDIILNYYFLMG